MQNKSFYKFGDGQSVRVRGENDHRIPEGTMGRVHARRAVTGDPQYLVRIEGRAHPYHFEEGQLEEATNG